VAVEPVAVTDDWARTRSAVERLSVRAYSRATAIPGFRQALRAVGPLWELRAEAIGGGLA
jgi:hypothetical protein